MVELVRFEAEDDGAGAPVLWSLSHNSEQLVFQKPIFEFSRSYITRVLRAMIPFINKHLQKKKKLLENTLEKNLAVKSYAQLKRVFWK